MAYEWVLGIWRDLDAENKAYRLREKILAESVKNQREWEIARTAARYELESDEFLTARQKAIAIVDQCHGGCTLWRCGRTKGHTGPCQPK